MVMFTTAITLLSIFTSGPVDVDAFGAKGDGVADDTAAFQSALDSAAKLHTTVIAGSGNYVFKGRLNVPEGVALKGTWESVPSHNGLRDPGLPKPTDGGTTFMVEGAKERRTERFLPSTPTPH